MTGLAPSRRAALVLVVTMLGTLMVFSSTTSINVALPAIADALHPGAGVVDWYLLSYMLANSVLILVFARISDFLGRRTIYLGGVALMSAASIACALAPDTVVFIAMRALQGVGAAVVLTNVNALVADVFPEGRRSAALGLNVMGGSVAGALGPVLGGVLVSSLGWQSVFVVNVPFGLAGLVLGYVVLPRRTATPAAGERFDGAGAVLSIVTLFSLLFAINRISAWGISDLRVVASFVVAVLAFSAFAVVESRQTSPLIDLDVITRGRRYFAYSAVFCISVPQSTLPIAIVLYEQLVLGRSATSAGFVIIPFAVVVAITAPVAGQVAHRHPPHRLPILGGLTMSLGLVCLLGYFTLGAPGWLLLVALLVAGLGNGLFHTPNISVIMSGIPSNRFGVAGGVRSVLFNSSQSIGTAVVLLVLGSWFTRAGGAGLSRRIADPQAVEPAFVIVSLLMIACALGCTLFSALASRPLASPPDLRTTASRKRSRATIGTP